MTGTRVKPFRPPKNPAKCRISPQLRTAITSMITEGLTRSEAAAKAGITDHALYQALRKQHVIKFKTDVLRAYRESEAERSLVKVVTLRETAKSENVQLESAKTVLSLDDRFTPATKIKHEHSGNVTFTPGYAIDLTADEAPPLIGNQVIDAEIVD